MNKVISNSISGWVFNEIDRKDAICGNKIINPSIDLSNACNLNCKYCYSENIESERKVVYDDELTFREIIKIIDAFAKAGSKSINIVGSGEPTIYPFFKEVVKKISERNIIPVVFTNGVIISSNYQLVEFLYKNNVSIVIKYNSSNSDIQDLLVGRTGYSIKRDKALECLIDFGFNSYNPTRLGFDVIVFNEVIDEIPGILRYCRRNNIFPIIADYIPSGRTYNGVVADANNGNCLVDMLGNKSGVKLMPPTNDQKYVLYNELKRIDEVEFGILHDEFPAYYSGIPCTQMLGLYVDIHGDIWPCVAKGGGD